MCESEWVNTADSVWNVVDDDGVVDERRRRNELRVCDYVVI